MALDNKKILMSFIAFCFVVFAITAITINLNQEDKTSNNPSSSTSVTPNNSDSYNNSDQEEIDDKNVVTKLSISNKCIGCNKCSRIDSEHFRSLGGRSIPEVISSNNLDSSNLKTAIAMCPVDAISLN